MSAASYVLTWLDNPDGGGTYIGQRDKIRAHDQTCPGLAHAWLPSKGGATCLGDLAPECDGGCGITFFWEGVVSEFEDCPESNHWYCPCCLAKVTACGCTGATL